MGQSDRKDLIKFLNGLIFKTYLTPEKRLKVILMENKPVTHICGKELKLVNGVMDLVGEDIRIGESFEVRLLFYDAQKSEEKL